MSPSSPQPTPTPLRVYRYVVDVHGQLFLHDQVPKNLTSCFKNTAFLDFFFTRLRPNPSSPTSRDGARIAQYDILSAAPASGPQWPDDPRLQDADTDTDTARQLACRLANDDGYEWLSPCGPELNFVKTQDTPIVFRELTSTGKLHYAGSLQHDFAPDSLHVDPSTGYLYHPSPDPTSDSVRTRRRAKSKPDSAQRYGRFSLLSSSLVLQHLAHDLEIDPDQFHAGDAGSVQWQGTRYPLRLLPSPAPSS
ncbi:uncharacterized protein PFL1_04646 [Pseudozyma flocculosa PF-1]|uniref:Uncharacterized protein n=1 Tax=Pseudozyma flocculosa PF-1 TaxID=1277687 RepID=A0A061H4Q5_9BASI|nr:uncharacterized protein PFL1_04646 [Pseudozyma flocculosa PF-1]EPQ27902.1 hypothetical protein PFL1_04646 [Pseudozyma flocculosa PF-1]